MEHELALRVEGISKRMDAWEVLGGISFSVCQGETLGIIGPSGCGKSTLLKVIAGHLSPDEGRVCLYGETIRGYTRRIALMPQQDMLLPWMTVLDNTALPLRLAKAPKKEAREKARAYFEDFGLSGFERAYPHQLSGGMRQRASILRTVLSQAEIFLLDEPFGALDAITRGQMQEFLRRKREQLGVTLLFVTHDVEEAIYLSDRVIVLGGSPARITLSLPLPKKDRAWMLTPQCAQVKQQLFETLEDSMVMRES